MSTEAILTDLENWRSESNVDAGYCLGTVGNNLN